MRKSCDGFGGDNDDGGDNADDGDNDDDGVVIMVMITAIIMVVMMRKAVTIMP